MSTLINPRTKRRIQRGGKTHLTLIQKGILSKETLHDNSDESNTFQNLLRKRDPSYFRSIKEIIPRMPDIRVFYSPEALSSLEPWTLEKRYEVLLRDLEGLDAASSLGRDNDVKLVEAMNEKDPDEPLDKWYSFSDKERELLEDDYNAADFVATYPALSWILVVTIPSFRLWALKYSKPSYQKWVRDVNMDEPEAITVSEFITDPDLMKIVLDSVNLDDYSYYPAEHLMDMASSSHNAILLRYLAENGPQTYPTTIWRFIHGGDVEALKIALSRQIKGREMTRKDLGKDIYDALESYNIPMIDFFEEMRGKPLEFDEISETVIANAIEFNKIDFLQWMKTRDFIISPEEIIGAISSHAIKPETVDYLLSTYSLSPFEFHNIEIRYKVREDRNAFMSATGNPRILHHLIDKYGKDATEEDWQNALDAAQRDYEYWMKKDPDTYEKSIQILLHSHTFNK